MSAGGLAWTAWAAVAAGVLAATGLSEAGRRFAVWRLLERLLSCWAGRLVLLAAWAEAGFHLFSQRP